MEAPCADPRVHPSEDCLLTLRIPLHNCFPAACRVVSVHPSTKAAGVTCLPSSKWRDGFITAPAGASSNDSFTEETSTVNCPRSFRAQSLCLWYRAYKIVAGKVNRKIMSLFQSGVIMSCESTTTYWEGIRSHPFRFRECSG